MKKLLLIFVSVVLTSSVYSQNLQISGGNSFSVALCDNQDVYAWGNNNVGQFGLNSAGTPYAASSSATPVQVYISAGLPLRAKQIDAGSGSHAVALGCDGFVYVWGESVCQQNGQGGAIGVNCECSSVTSATPLKVKCGEATAPYCSGGFLTGVKYISGANNATYAILNNGEVLAWGENSFGQLGNGNITDQSLPVFVLKDDGTRLTGITQIEGGDRCTYALDGTGQVWSWGLNQGRELGRPQSPAPYEGTSGSTCGPASGSIYSSAAGRVLKSSTSTDYLTGIFQISGGDTHGLALSTAGEVWSWGGDWGGGPGGDGQLGQGSGYQATDYASRVNAPGNTTAGSPPYLSDVVFIAAGQASSAAVLSNGKIVTWGGNGFFMGCATNNSIPSGVLGNGSATGVACVAATGSPVPVYVQTSAGVDLTGMTRISDGDAWYFAQGPGGTYAWGENTNGQLSASGDDKNFATAISPGGCTMGDVCPTKPILNDATLCFGFSQALSAGSAKNSYAYSWEYSATGNAPWTVLSAPVVGTGNTFTATQTNNGFGYYRVVIDDNRLLGPGACGPCPVVGDTMRIQETTAPFSGTGAYCVGGVAVFNANPNINKYKWFKDASGGSALNPDDSNYTITVPLTSLNGLNTVPGCSGIAIFLQDVTSYSGTLLPATTIADAPCAGSGSTETGDRSPLLLEVRGNIDLTSVGFIIPQFGSNYSKDYTVKIYNSDPAGSVNCTNPPCNPSGNREGKGALIYTSPTLTVAGTSADLQRLIDVPIDFSLTGSTVSPQKYFIEITGGELIYFNSCTPTFAANSHLWNTPYFDNSPNPGVLRGISSFHDNQYQTSSGTSHIVNLEFQVGVQYSCGRNMICATAVDCTLPVDYLSFDARKSGASSALLTWGTANEKNSNYFVIEKSVNGNNFLPIGTVKTSGNSNTILNYSFTDQELGTGMTYYRLVQYDLDGSVHYSKIISLSNATRDVQIVPNPNNGSFTVTFFGMDDTTAKIILLNALGQVVYLSESIVSINNIDIQFLPSGIYYLQVNTDDESIVKKILKE